MANTQIGSILNDFLNLFSDVFTVGQYINIKDVPYNINYYGCCLLNEGDFSRHMTNRAKYTYKVDFIVYINNINDDYNQRLQFVLDTVLTRCNYEEYNGFRAFCGQYNLINAGVPVVFRTGQGILLDKRQELIVFNFVFYKD